jgi:hypothetical protein
VESLDCKGALVEIKVPLLFVEKSESNRPETRHLNNKQRIFKTGLPDFNLGSQAAVDSRPDFGLLPVVKR